MIDTCPEQFCYVLEDVISTRDVENIIFWFVDNFHIATSLNHYTVSWTEDRNGLTSTST